MVYLDARCLGQVCVLGTQHWRDIEANYLGTSGLLETAFPIAIYSLNNRFSTYVNHQQAGFTIVSAVAQLASLSECYSWRDRGSNRGS